MNGAMKTNEAGQQFLRENEDQNVWDVPDPQPLKKNTDNRPCVFCGKTAENCLATAFPRLSTRFRFSVDPRPQKQIAVCETCLTKVSSP